MVGSDPGAHTAWTRGHLQHSLTVGPSTRSLLTFTPLFLTCDDDVTYPTVLLGELSGLISFTLNSKVY